MPYTTIWFTPEVFMEHGDVTVYHVYKNDNLDEGVRRYWYTTSEEGGDTDGLGEKGTFDVRGLPGGDVLNYDDDSERIKAVIAAAIDKGLVK